MPPLRLRLRGDCSDQSDTSGACQRGMVLRSETGAGRCPPKANAFAFSLATSLMVAIIIFKAGDGSFSVVPASEYDGDAAAIVHEIDPFVLTGATRPWKRNPRDFRSQPVRFRL
jgi:hypothetical protein